MAMTDQEAHKIIRDMLDKEVSNANTLGLRLQAETEEYKREPAEDTAAIIQRIERQYKEAVTRAEALAITVSKF